MIEGTRLRTVNDTPEPRSSVAQLSNHADAARVHHRVLTVRQQNLMTSSRDLRAAVAQLSNIRHSACPIDRIRDDGMTVVNKSVDGAGHHVARLPNRPTADSVRVGGTPEGLAAAQRSSWRAIVEFLDRHLGPRR
jgi:hypothetical protein